jgi:hypothetical protein
LKETKSNTTTNNNNKTTTMISLFTKNAKELLTWVALFLGELRDGLTMVREEYIWKKNSQDKRFTR